jgi:cobalt-zinc-cadmium efflux system outer membrane protein
MRRILAPLAASLLGNLFFFIPANAENASVNTADAPAASIGGRAKTPLSLIEAIAWAERESPFLKASGSDTRWAQARRDAANAHPNPELELGVEDIRLRPQGDENRFEAYTVGLTQPLEWLGKRSARRALAEVEVRGRELDTAQKRARHHLSIAEAIIDAARLQRLAALAKERVTLAQRLSGIATERVKAGKISALEESQLLASTLLARAESQDRALELEGVRRQLATLLGAKAEAFGEISFDIDSLPPLPSPSANRSLSSIALLRADNEVDEARARLSLERHSVVPDLTLSGEVIIPRASARPLVSVGVGIPLPLFERNQGARGEALANAEAAPLRAQSERDAHAQERAQSLAVLTSALQKARVLKEGALNLLQRNQASLEEAYAQGRLGYLDVVTNQESLSSMREKYLEALAQAHVSAFRLEALLVSGEIPKTETASPSEVRTRP